MPPSSSSAAPGFDPKRVNYVVANINWLNDPSKGSARPFRWAARLVRRRNKISEDRCAHEVRVDELQRYPISAIHRGLQHMRPGISTAPSPKPVTIKTGGRSSLAKHVSQKWGTAQLSLFAYRIGMSRTTIEDVLRLQAVPFGINLSDKDIQR